MAPARTHLLPTMQAWWSSVCKIGICHHFMKSTHIDQRKDSPAGPGFCWKVAASAASFSRNHSTSPVSQWGTKDTIDNFTLGLTMLSLGLMFASFRPGFELKTDVGGRFSISDILWDIWSETRTDIVKWKIFWFYIDDSSHIFRA